MVLKTTLPKEVPINSVDKFIRDELFKVGFVYTYWFMLFGGAYKLYQDGVFKNFPNADRLLAGILEGSVNFYLIAAQFCIISVLYMISDLLRFAGITKLAKEEVFRISYTVGAIISSSVLFWANNTIYVRVLTVLSSTFFFVMLPVLIMVLAFPNVKG